MRRRSWTDEDLAAAVASAESIAGVLRELGLRPGGGTYVTVKRRIAALGLDTEHFTGQAWQRGRPNLTDRSRYTLEEILVEDSRYLDTWTLKRRLWRAGLLPRCCQVCGLERWRDAPAPLQLDHVNGDRRDNRLENLRILCPNCHAQTATWCGRNVGRYDRS